MQKRFLLIWENEKIDVLSEQDVEKISDLFYCYIKDLRGIF